MPYKKVTKKNLEKRYSKGFTLIELLLSISLLAISVGISSDIIVTLVRTYTKAQVFNDTEQVAGFIFQKLQNDVKGSVEATSLNGNTLNLTKKDGTTITYVLSTGLNPQLTRDTGSGAIALIDSASSVGGISITCDSLCFEVINSNPAIVKINFIFSQSSGAGLFNTTLQMEDAFVVRGTY
ncbi:MAG TPA: prepilin-type N-terminal cleavage/methylation domain-containing protein [candidate division WWE3 bacterium]|uniref:Prepilin-type N-terminal cleavage/methylation domain-containing protein n=1 Tax=candidate division WWE3 bacterium TaxID=2053526 RepID=A0A7C1HGR9_UNCKA|nr:prepilin-type N-terminal cleavage/methylation domain-containing protein [candidate division WWE3 bacterium]